MAGAKLVVLYPMPKDVKAFEQVYTKEHEPMVTPKTFGGLQKFVASRVMATPDGGPPPFQRIAELYFESIDALQKAAASASAQQAVAHALKISTGGTPVFLVAEEVTRTF